MNKHSVSAYHNQPKSVEFRDEYIWITVMDGRIIAAPLSWYPWLENASPEQRNNYDLLPFSIIWEELEDGIDMEMLSGNHMRDVVSPAKMAKMHDVAENTINRILRSEIDMDEEDQRIPGAFFYGEGRRRRWYIPKASAESFEVSNRGRKSGN